MKTTLDRADFERVDRVAKRLYGSERGGTLEALLAANPGLSELALSQVGYLVRGTELEVPTEPAPEPNPALKRPWE